MPTLLDIINQQPSRLTSVSTVRSPDTQSSVTQMPSSINPVSLSGTPLLSTPTVLSLSSGNTPIYRSGTTGQQVSYDSGKTWISSQQTPSITQYMRPDLVRQPSIVQYMKPELVTPPTVITKPPIIAQTNISSVQTTPAVSGFVSPQIRAMVQASAAEKVFTPVKITPDQKVTVPVGVSPTQIKGALDFIGSREAAKTSQEYKDIVTAYGQGILLNYQQKLAAMTPEQRTAYKPTAAELDVLAAENKKITGDPKLDFKGNPMLNPYLTDTDRTLISSGKPPEWFTAQQKAWQSGSGPAVEMATSAVTAVSTANAIVKSLEDSKQAFDKQNVIPQLEVYNKAAADLKRANELIELKYGSVLIEQNGKKVIPSNLYNEYQNDLKTYKVDELFNTLQKIEPDLQKNIKKSESMQSDIDKAYNTALKKYETATKFISVADNALAEDAKKTNKYYDMYSNASIPTIAYIQKYGIETPSQLQARTPDLIYYKDMNITNKSLSDVFANVEKTYKEDIALNRKLSNDIDIGVAAANIGLAPINLPSSIINSVAGTKFGVDTTEWKTPLNISFGPTEISVEQQKQDLQKIIDKTKSPQIREVLQKQLANIKEPIPTLPTVARDILGLGATIGYTGGEILRGGPSRTAYRNAEVADQARKDFYSSNFTLYDNIIKRVRNPIPSGGVAGVQQISERDTIYAKAFEDAQLLTEEQFRDKYLMIDRGKIASKEAQSYAVGQLGTEAALIFAPTPTKATIPSLAFKALQKAELANMLIQGQSGTQAASNLALGFGTGALFDVAMKGGSYLDAKLVDKLGAGMRTKNTIYTFENADIAAKLQKAGKLEQAIESGQIVPIARKVETFATKPWIATGEKIGEVIGKYALPTYFTGTLVGQNVELVKLAGEKGLDEYRTAKKAASSSLAGLILGAPAGTAFSEKLTMAKDSPFNIGYKARDIAIQQASLPDALSPGRGNPLQRVTIQEGTAIKIPGTPMTPEAEFVVGKRNVKIIDTAASPLNQPTVSQYKSDAELAFNKKLKDAAEVAKNRSFDEAVNYTQWSDLKNKPGEVGQRITKALEAWKNYLTNNSGDVGLGGSSSSAWSYDKTAADKVFKQNPDLKAKDFDVVVKPLLNETITTEAQAVKAAKEFTNKGLNVAVQRGYGEVNIGEVFAKNPDTDIVIFRGQGGWEATIKTNGLGPTGKPTEHFASIHGMKASGLLPQVNTINDLLDFSRTTDWVKTKEGIEVLNPATQARRKLIGGYTEPRPKDIDWFKNIAYDTYGSFTGGKIRPVMEATASNLSTLSQPQLKLVLQTLADPSKEFTGSKADGERLSKAIRLVEAETGIFSVGKHLRMGTAGFFDPATKDIAINPLLSKINKELTLLHETTHSVDPYAQSKGYDDFASRAGRTPAESTKQMLIDAQYSMTPENYLKFTTKLDNHPASGTEAGRNIEGMAFFAEFAPKEVMNPTTETGRYIKDNLLEYGNLRMKGGTQISNQLEAFDLLANKRPVFSVEKSVVLNPYETPQMQSNIISAAGNKQINVAATPENVKFFKDSGFLNTKNIFFPAPEGQFSLTKFAQNQFINPKDIVSPTMTVYGPPVKKGPSIVLSIPEVQFKQKLADMTPDVRAKYKPTKSEIDMMDRILRDRLTGELISIEKLGTNVSNLSNTTVNKLYKNYLSYVKEMNTINKNNGLNSFVKAEPTMNQFLKELKTVQSSVKSSYSPQERIINEAMSKLKTPKSIKTPLPEPTAEQIRTSTEWFPSDFFVNNLEAISNFKNISGAQKTKLYNDFVTATVAERNEFNKRNPDRAVPLNKSEIINFTEFSANMLRESKTATEILNERNARNLKFKAEIDAIESKFERNQPPIVGVAPGPAPLMFSPLTTSTSKQPTLLPPIKPSAPSTREYSQQINYATAPILLIPGIPQESLVKEPKPKEKVDVYTELKDTYNKWNDGYKSLSEINKIESVDYSSTKIPSVLPPVYEKQYAPEPYTPPYNPPAPYTPPYTLPTPYTPPYNPPTSYAPPYDYGKYDYGKYDYGKYDYSKYDYGKYPYEYSKYNPGYMPGYIPGKYTAPPTGGPVAGKQKGEQKPKKTRPLIQLKSSLFRKFAFGEKDLLVNPQDIAGLRNIIAQKGTFLGYDLVPTREQISREEARLLKSQDETKGLKDKSFLSIKV